MTVSASFQVVAFVFLGLASCAQAEVCQDRSSLCGSLTRYCGDSSHESWMKAYCTKTCAFCDDSCKDLSSLCPQLVRHCGGNDMDEQDEQQHWMRNFCEKTCNYCDYDGGEVSSTPATEEVESTQTIPEVTTRPEPEPEPTPKPEPEPTSEPEPEPTRESKVGDCGVPEYQGSRIVGGNDAAPGKWPWQILMLYNGFAGCGGSIINANWVLSAAHCVHTLTEYTSDFTIRTGEFNRDVYEDSEREYDVEKIIIHPNYDPRVLNNDISLIKLKTPIMFDKFRQPVCLPSKPAQKGDECYITGWGKLKWTELMTPILQEGKLPIVDSKTCDTLNRKQIHIPVTDAMLCAGSGGKSTLSGCHGDSGGPFVCRYGNHWELQGAVSHGSPYCNSTQSYTVFASVSHFLPWVQKTMAREQ